jgi:hypothetical protein
MLSLGLTVLSIPLLSGFSGTTGHRFLLVKMAGDEAEAAGCGEEVSKCCDCSQCTDGTC